MQQKHYAAYNKAIDHQIEALKHILKLNPILNTIICSVPELNLDVHYYLGAGCITQTVWNYLSGVSLAHGINDIDLVYYDEDLSYEKENKVIQRANELFKELPIKIDIKNQARVHLWYEQHFGYPIEQYQSLEEAINTWPTTATAIGVRVDPEDNWTIYAPFGLNDMFGMIVRANKVQITKEIYEKKVLKWRELWPELKINSWC